LGDLKAVLGSVSDRTDGSQSGLQVVAPCERRLAIVSGNSPIGLFTLALRVRTCDLNHTPRPRSDSKSEAVLLCDRGYQVQTKTQAGCVSYLIRPVKAPQDGVAFVFTYAGTSVPNTHDVFVVAAK
jgi:hypothetical protein